MGHFLPKLLFASSSIVTQTNQLASLTRSEQVTEGIEFNSSVTQITGTGKSGDLPPIKECADLWREEVLESTPKIEFTLVIGQHAIAWHIPEAKKENLTDTVRDWRNHWPDQLPLPHPSPRNSIWL